MNFTTAKLVCAERFLRKSIGEIIKEANADGGMSLHTLTALLAASRSAMDWKWGMLMDVEPESDPDFIRVLHESAKEIDKRGASVVAAEVGEALGQFVKKHFAAGEAG